jgi:hypothetical protein
MLLLATMLPLLIVAMAFGFARRPWWQIGVLAVLVCGPLQVANLLTDDWRYQVGLARHEQPVDLQMPVMIVATLLLCSYLGYALGLLYARRRAIAVERSGGALRSKGMSLGVATNPRA